MLLNQLVQTSDKVASTSGRLAKIKLLAELLKQAAPDEIETVIAYLSGTIRLSVGHDSPGEARRRVGDA